jgi:hypothetical protein
MFVVSFEFPVARLNIVIRFKRLQSLWDFMEFLMRREALMLMNFVDRETTFSP